MIIWLYIAIVCFGPILELIIPKTSFGPGMPDIGIVRILSMILILSFLLQIALTRKVKIFYKWFIFIIVYSTVAVFSVFWSNYTYNSSTIQFLFDEFVMHIIIILIAFNLFYDKKNINIYMKSICISSLIFSIFTSYQLLSGPFYKMLFGGKSVEMARATGVFDNPNAMAIILVLSIPCIIYSIENRLFARSIGWGIILCVIIAVICTVSRKGIVAAMLSFFIFYALKRQTLKVIIVCSLLIFLLGIFTGIELFSERFSDKKITSDLETKWELTEAGLKMFATSPAIGLGHEGYRDNYKKYFPYSYSKKGRPAHNIYVKVLAEYGLIGFLPFILIFIYPILFSIKVYTGNNDPEKMQGVLDLAIFCISSIIPFMLIGWFAGGLYSNKYVFQIFYTNIALFITFANSILYYKT